MTVPQTATPVPLTFDPAGFSVHAQWGPRGSTIEQTGRLLVQVLKLTADADPRITVWFPADNDDWGYAVTGLPERAGPLTALAGHLATGEPPSVHVSFETSDVERTGAPLTTLDAVIGATDPYEPNLVTWHLLNAGERFLASPQAALSFLHALIRITDCDWAAISSDTIDKVQPVNPDAPVTGWATYISYRTRPILAQPPHGITATPMTRGTLYTVADRPEGVSVESIRRMSAWMDATANS